MLTKLGYFLYNMGALTLKSFPFILRSWNIKSYPFFDPTDSFGQETLVYVNKNQVIKIEPQFSNSKSSSWLTDKGRLFFDSFFTKTSSKNVVPELKEKKEWDRLFKILYKTFYLFSICNLKYSNKFFFLLVFENVSIEIVNFLSLISQLNPFIKIKRAEKVTTDLNLESNFQINSATSYSKLASSSLCLLVGVNPRYEGSYLNLKLRQRYLKGNFKVLLFGSFVDLTFPVSFIGSNSFMLNNFVEGNHLLCKDVVISNNPLFITSTEVLKRNSVKEIVNLLKNLKYLNFLNEIWSGFNFLSSSLYDTGLNSFSRFSFLTFKDLLSFSSFYALNVNLNCIPNVHVAAESRILKFKSVSDFLNKKLFVLQHISDVPNFAFSKKYFYLPASSIFENQYSFVNTEGFRKVGSKLIFKKNTKSDWQILRKLVQNLNCSFSKKFLFYDNNSLFDFKSFINFHFQATSNFMNFNNSIFKVNKKFVLHKQFDSFKLKTCKVLETTIKFWLSDFYLGGKDNFCQNSLNLVRCSLNYKQLSTIYS